MSGLFIHYSILVLAPSLDVNILKLSGAECVDERTRQTAVGNQWHVEVDGGTTNLVTMLHQHVGRVEHSHRQQQIIILCLQLKRNNPKSLFYLKIQKGEL